MIKVTTTGTIEVKFKWIEKGERQHLNKLDDIKKAFEEGFKELVEEEIGPIELEIKEFSSYVEEIK